MTIISDGSQVTAQGAGTEGGFFIDQSGNSHYFYTSANGEQQQVMTVVAGKSTCKYLECKNHNFFLVTADGDDGQGESIAISIPANIDDANDAGGGEATYITMPRADGSDGTIAMETSDDVRFIHYLRWPRT